MSPKVSIIIPAYNVAPYIAECLQSVLAQTFLDWEVVLVDDGSTDTTVAEVQKIEDKRIQIIQQQNAGPSKVRNTGVKQAKGEFILYLDSDDRLHPDTLQTCCDTIQTHAVDAVTFDGYNFTVENGQEQISRDTYFDRSRKLQEKVYSGQEFLKTEVLQKAVVVQPCVYMVTKEKILQVPFEESILHEDVLYHYELLEHLDTIYYLPQQFYQRRLREDSIVHTATSLKSLTSYHRIIKELEAKYANERGERKRLYQKIIAKNMLQVGKLGKRYLFGKATNKREGLSVLKETLSAKSFTLGSYKKIYCFLGAIYYLFADIFSK